MLDIILFPSSFFHSKKVDEDLQSEYDAVERTGLYKTIIFGYEKWFNEGKLILSEKPETLMNAAYRGWMMKPEQYKQFYEELLARNIKLITSPDEYQLFHVFPNIYPLVEEDTAKMFIYPKGTTVPIDEIKDNFSKFMVKDYVKSVKGTEFPKYFDHTITQQEFNKWMEVFYQYRGDLFTGGICIKEFLALKHYETKTNEYRVYYINHEIATVSQNSGQSTYTPAPPKELLEKYKALPGCFYTIDYAELEDGSWRIIEAGDGQVSGLSETQDYEDFYRKLSQCFEIVLNCVSDIIKIYKPQLKYLGKRSMVSEYDRLNHKFMDKLHEVTNAEGEIAEYFKSAIEIQDWEDAIYWETAAIVHPSVLYLDYFFEILKIKKLDDASIYWRVLNCLICMPKECEDRIVEGIEEVIVLNNPSWDNETLYKAFENLGMWLGDEKKVLQFFESQCKSESKRIAQMAEYWIKWVNDDWDNDEYEAFDIYQYAYSGKEINENFEELIDYMKRNHIVLDSGQMAISGRVLEDLQIDNILNTSKGTLVEVKGFHAYDAEFDFIPAGMTCVLITDSMNEELNENKILYMRNNKTNNRNCMAEWLTETCRL